MQKLEPSARKQRISVTLSPKLKKFYDALPDRIRSRFVENAIIKYISICSLDEIVREAVEKKSTIPAGEIRHDDISSEHSRRGNDINAFTQIAAERSIRIDS